MYAIRSYYVNFENAGSGKVKTEPVPFTTWSSVVNSSSKKSETNTSIPAVKHVSATKATSQAAVKYNFRKNVGKGGTKPPQTRNNFV